MTNETHWELENEVPHNTYIPGSLAKIAVIGSIAVGFALIVWSTF